MPERRRMKVALVAATLAPSAVQAEQVKCMLRAACEVAKPCDRAPLALRFEIDRNQFSPAIAKGEPPRRKVTMVELGNQRFVAEPMIIGDVRGFWEDAEAMGSRIFTLQPDGSGIYTEDPAGIRLTGNCEVTQ